MLLPLIMMLASSISGYANECPSLTGTYYRKGPRPGDDKRYQQVEQTGCESVRVLHWTGTNPPTHQELILVDGTTYVEDTAERTVSRTYRWQGSLLRFEIETRSKTKPDTVLEVGQHWVNAAGEMQLDEYYYVDGKTQPTARRRLTWLPLQ